MNIVIAGAGEVGRHAAEILAADGQDVTVIDLDKAALEQIGDLLDVKTLRGGAADAATLREAGVADADLVIAATDGDETNLLCAAAAKFLGAKKSIARVHHGAYYSRKHLDYAARLGIDRLVCPEFITAVEIAGSLRNPGAMAVEHFAREELEMQQIAVTEGADAIGVPLRDLKLPRGTRLGTVSRDGIASIPDSQTTLLPGDIITLVGETRTFEQASKLFQAGKIKRRHIVIMGGSAIGVWIARALRGRAFSVRLFERNRARAEVLADKLPHITVIQADPTDPAVFTEEGLESADAFVAATNDDEHNLLASMLFKSNSKARTIAVLQRATYIKMLERIGLDQACSPRILASKEILRIARAGRIQSIATLAESTAYVYEVRPVQASPALGIPLSQVKLPAQCTIAAILRDGKVTVPGGDDAIKAGDSLVVIAPHGAESKLKKIFLK